jgi:hypothetical protein
MRTDSSAMSHIRAWLRGSRIGSVMGGACRAPGQVRTSIRLFAYPRAHDEDGRSGAALEPGGDACVGVRDVVRDAGPQRPARRRRARERACGRRTARARAPTGSRPTFVHLRRGEELSGARTRFDGAVAVAGRGGSVHGARTTPGKGMPAAPPGARHGVDSRDVRFCVEGAVSAELALAPAVDDLRARRPGTRRLLPLWIRRARVDRRLGLGRFRRRARASLNGARK